VCEQLAKSRYRTANRPTEPATYSNVNTSMASVTIHWQATFTCCLKETVASFVPQAPEHALFQEYATATVTGVCLQPDRVCYVEQPAISSHVRHDSDIGYNDFKRQLKTYLFG